MWRNLRMFIDCECKKACGCGCGAADAGADAILFKGEDALEDEHPWRLTDDEVPLLKRKPRHWISGTTKRTRVVLSDDDNPIEEPQRCFTAAEKGKEKIADSPVKEHHRRRFTKVEKGKRKNDETSATSKAAKKRKTRDGKVNRKDDIAVNEVCISDDEYVEAARPLPSFPLHTTDARPFSPCSRMEKWIRRPWGVYEKVKWAQRYKDLGSLKKTLQESSASFACIQRWAAQVDSGVFKGAANCSKGLNGAGRHSHHPDMEAALYWYICLEPQVDE
ncbi:unnamed protein product [Closterium sp. Yama58-4]|nr:unnamed protein product [Closterium sp. Yama58-4]